MCWGDNAFEQAGVTIEDALSVASPRWVAQHFEFQEIDLAPRHSCGLAHNGTVWCWGSNEHNELKSNYDVYRSAIPIPIEGIAGPATRLASGGWSSCAIDIDSSVACWGNWQLDPYAPRTPTLVDGVRDAIGIDRNADTACAVTGDGGVSCWGGFNVYGQLGDGNVGADFSRDDAAPVVGLPESATHVALGGDFVCAVLASGDAACWGRGDFGFLGDGTFESKALPTLVIDLTSVVDLSANLSHVCAVLNDGGVACWGNNTFSPEPVADFATPQRVAGIANVVDVAVGAWFTCALTADQEIYCWGENQNSQLGLGEGAPSFVLTPTRVDWRAALP